jgi:hypothetical protein
LKRRQSTELLPPSDKRFLWLVCHQDHPLAAVELAIGLYSRRELCLIDGLLVNRLRDVCITFDGEVITSELSLN